MDIKIGNNNKFKNSKVGHQINLNESENRTEEKRSFIQKHPVMVSFIVSMVAGFILLFSFWKNVVSWIENLFN